MKNILTVDVEEWFHPEAVQHHFSSDTWSEQHSRVNENVQKLLDLFEEKQVKATFFILGWIARKYPEMVKRIAASGHEIASHSNLHRMVTKLDPGDFRLDLIESLKSIEDIIGEKVIGFRAPTFSVVKDTVWAWDILLEAGLRYDSSVYPIWHDRYGMPDAPRSPYIAAGKNGINLIEFPMPTLKIFNKNIPFGGGGYLRLFPLVFTRFAIKKFNKENLPAIIYMHPWEFDNEQPRLSLGTVQTWRHYYNIDNNLAKLSNLLDCFEWGSFREIMEQSDYLQKLLEKAKHF